MNAPIPPLKHLQPKQYLSWLRRATDSEWDEERFGCGSRSKAERAAAAFALELSEAFERIATLTQECDSYKADASRAAAEAIERIAALAQQRDELRETDAEHDAFIDRLKTALGDELLSEVCDRAVGFVDEDIVRGIEKLRSKLALLTDPAAVHANILRGTLPLTKAQAIHIAGLPADVEEQLKNLRAEVERLSAPLRSEEVRLASLDDWTTKYISKNGFDRIIADRRKP